MASDNLSAMLDAEAAKETATNAAQGKRPKEAYHAPATEPPPPQRITKDEAKARISRQHKNISKFKTDIDAAIDATTEETKAKGEIERREKIAKKFSADYNQRKRLGDFADPLPDSQNPNAIFRTRYLRRGHTLLFVSILGLGKSTLVSQASECWAVGKPFHGIEPTRPLSIGVFETEDDDDEIADFRNNIRKGFTDTGWTQQEIRTAESSKMSPVYYPMANRYSGDQFLEYLEYCQSQALHDLIIINPVYDFIGGDLSKQEAVARWKGQLDRLATQYGFALLLVHHTNKVPTGKKERDEWCGGASAAYAGSGSMVLPSSSRAVIFMRPIKDGLVALEAAKRGKRLGWTDANGDPTTTKYLAHTDGYIFWREPTPEEVAEHGVKEAKPQHPHNADIFALCAAYGKPYESVTALTNAICAAHGVTDTSATKWIKYAIADGVIEKKPIEGSQSIRIGLPAQFGEATHEVENDMEPWYNK